MEFLLSIIHMNKLTKKLDKNILKLKKLNVKPGGQNSIVALRHPPIIPSCFWQIIFLLWAMIDKTLLYISLVKYLHYFKTSNKTNLCTITIFIITKFLFPSHIIRCQVMSMIPTYNNSKAQCTRIMIMIMFMFITYYIM